MRVFRLTIIVVLVATGLPFTSSAGSNVVEPAQLQPMREPIVNGVFTSGFPSVAELLFPDGICTGTLIGCRTVLSAAHCFCGTGTPGAICQPRTDVLVFFQHGGLFQVESVTVHPNYLFGTRSDLAVLRLVSPVDGVAPTPVNTLSRPPFGTAGLIAGFGRTGGESQVFGIKRAGSVITGSCPAGIPNSAHVCWRFGQPIGPPGLDSGTCQGDSGGPLFVDGGGEAVVAGVTSGGGPAFTECLAPTEAFNADTFADHLWVQDIGGPDLNSSTCGALPPAGSVLAPVLFAHGALSAANNDDVYSLEVPAGTELLRVAVNHESTGDFELAIKEGSPPAPGNYDCLSSFPAVIEGCDISSPEAGTWYLLANRLTGSGFYQLTATTFQAAGGSSGPCVEDGETLCLLNDRFRVRVSFRPPGQISRPAAAIPFTDRAGMFWFFNQNNIEMLVKMQNACVDPFNHFWLFYAATTNVELEVTVEDTEENITRRYSNPQGMAALPVQDTEAFATCP